MLLYLSNANSRAGGDNENYGRELLELHTLGRDAYLNDRYDRWRDVPGAGEGKPAGYIDEDVYEAARAFTGWTVENGQRLDAATELPRTGQVHLYRGLARRLPEARAGNGASALRSRPWPTAARCWTSPLSIRPRRASCASSSAAPSSATHPPQSLVDSAAKVWIGNARKPDQIAAVVKHIALSKEFAASAGAKPKSPLALAASFARVTGIDLSPTMPLINQLAQCGQRLFGWPTPDGRPTSADYYLTPEYLRERWVLLARLAANAWNTGEPKALLAAGWRAAECWRRGCALADAVRWARRIGGTVPGRAWHGAGQAAIRREAACADRRAVRRRTPISNVVRPPCD